MDLSRIPKVELHCHLELCFRHSSLVEIGKTLKIEVPSDPEVFRNTWLITKPQENLASVLNRFLLIQSLWASEEIIERLTSEVCEDAAAQGIRILELRYAPTFIQMNHPNLNFHKIHQSVVKGLRRASALKMAAGLICTVQRILPLKSAEEVSEFIIGNKDTFVGVDLADAEVGFDCRPFAPIFHRAREAGLGVTIHSGEEDVPQAAQFVRHAIEELGAQRIGHGLQIFKDAKVIEFVKAKKVPLELCPTSNWLTNAVPSPAQHPFRRLMEAGVLTTINSDDPSMFGIDLTHEYKSLQDHHGFGEKEFTYCNDIAAFYSFIPLKQKQAAWPRPINEPKR